ncbi:hypothetical protein HZC30_08235 [Candidatus Woesearchaeota archaeon]|nr:hypothetical protein [Candidatus Woesearchaeota archaeon]
MSRSLAKDTKPINQNLGKIIDQAGPLLASKTGLTAIKHGLIAAGSFCQMGEEMKTLEETVKKDPALPSLQDQEHYLYQAAGEIVTYGTKRIIEKYL